MKLQDLKNRKWNYVGLGFAFTFLAFFILMIVKGFAPFGDSSMLYPDAYHQYYPFFVAFRKALRQVSQRYPAQADAVAETLRELWEEEKAANPNPDRLCNLSGEMLGSVFVPKPDDVWAPVLRSLGSGLGRFVYWMDAWDDLEEDLKRKRFNPLAVYKAQEGFEDFCLGTLEMLIADAAEAFELLPLEQDLPILRNILYSGVWQRYEMKTGKARKKAEKEEKRNDK